MVTHITLLIAHNDRVFRSILYNILASYAGILVLAEVNTAEALAGKIKELQPAVVLAGLDLKGMSNKRAWEKLVTECGHAKIIISWQRRDAGKVREMMRHLRAGYIAWDASPSEYAYAVKQVAKGREYYCSQTQILREGLNEAAFFAKKLDDTWLRMLYCIYMGYINKEIAIATGLKENTVKSYRKKLKSITGFRSVAALEGWING